MNRILKEIEKIIGENRKTYLPDVQEAQLEEGGSVYYMNGKNGTEFDWYVNQKLSDFMVFYNDEDNMGAVKLTLYADGTICAFLYGDSGQTLLKEVRTEIDFSEAEIRKLAVLLKERADDRLLWDTDIRKIDTDSEISDEKMEEFSENVKFYEGMIARKRLMSCMAYVSKRILEEGWKVGYMLRDEALHEQDSGWSFMVGNEEDTYINDSKNIVLLQVGQVCQLDPDVFAHIDSPVGTAFIRVSSDKFEVDTNEKEIFLQKR